MDRLNRPIDLSEEVRAARDRRRPVVALETTAIAHGLPYPANREVADRLHAAVRAGGAVPALIGVLDGRIRVGADETMLDRFARGADMPKVSRRDLAITVGLGRDGATTVSGTMICAAIAGIGVFATGGLGGVHRRVAESLDISADLADLARLDVTVVASGAKSILDLPKTLEALETLGVPVIGYGTETFPAFQVRSSGLALDARVDTPAEIARVVAAKRLLGLSGGLLVAHPVPVAEALEGETVEGWIATALQDAEREGVTGKRITPFLLSRLAELSDGRTLDANIALLESNARLAGEIARELAAAGSSPDQD